MANIVKAESYHTDICNRNDTSIFNAGALGQIDAYRMYKLRVELLREQYYSNSGVLCAFRTVTRRGVETGIQQSYCRKSSTLYSLRFTFLPFHSRATSNFKFRVARLCELWKHDNG
jgi:hypothetical protein